MQKMRFQYRVSIMNENTLEEAWFLRLSRFSVFMYTSFLIILTFAILTSIIFYTPLKYYLPGYGGEVERMEIIDKSIKIDFPESYGVAGSLFRCVERYCCR